MCLVPVSLEQLLGCYEENTSCTQDDNTCRLFNFVTEMSDGKHELRQCAAACRLNDNLLFAKTVSKLYIHRVRKKMEPLYLCL